MAQSEMSGRAWGRRLKRAGGVLLRVYVLFHLVAITSWSLPPPPKAVSSGRVGPYGSDWILLANERYVRKSIAADYVLWTGFWQFWDMFSPDPASIDFWGDADVTFKDGAVRRHQYPRMYILPIPAKYIKERYRKFYERAHPDEYAYLWPVFAQRIALENLGDPSNPPVKVALRRHWMKIPKPGQPMPREYVSYVYYVHDVDQEALQRALGSP
jgi:hypothetical protein